jgi:hypothetical protein
MSFSFNELKRDSATSFDKLTSELSKLNSGQQQQGGRDERLWSCQLDKAGNGYAIIRFLPAPGGEDVPFVRLFTHGFKGPGGWYIENCLSTVNTPDPVMEMNNALWNQGEGSEGRKRVTGQGRDNPGTKRQLSYFSNVYVVSDPANPENEGKVFLFKYGKKIYDKLNDMMNPTFPGEVPVNPFDFWAGANFALKIRRVDGYANFDKSEFEKPAPLADDDKLEAIWKSQYSLQDLVSQKNFKTYDELKTKLDRVLGNAPAGSNRAPRQVVEDDTPPWDTAPQPQFKAAAPRPAPIATADDDDEDMAFFKSLADDD